MKLFIIIISQLFCLHFYLSFVQLQTLMTFGARVPLASVMPLLAANSYLNKQQQLLQPYNSYPIYSLRNYGGYYPWTATGMRRFLPIYSNYGYGNIGYPGNGFGYNNGYGNRMYPPNGIYDNNNNNYYPNDNNYGNSQYNNRRGGNSGSYNNNYGYGRVNDDDYGTMNTYDTSNTNYPSTSLKGRSQQQSSYRYGK
ncbi:hypothetical protein BLA29_005847 [Euroglyphus maynei]|uniref:Uncharacterized protein n=1 Tax=Euroglyphus maynei TaxID=6958 RepID=A0A1Y3B8M4_EURMA|nr:hypothetical protein BLA29_005847 [Euroglyphus maynei]